MSQLICEYHPNRDAIDKCHSCNRLICLEDKQVVNTANSGSARLGSRMGVYCSTCYYDLAKSLNTGLFSKNLAGAISFIILLFFGGILLLFSLLGITSTFLTYFFVLFIAIAISIIWVVQFFVSSMSSSPIDIDQARLLHQKLINSRSSYSHKVKSKKTEFCMSCGTAIIKDEKICLSCGEELYPVK